MSEHKTFKRRELYDLVWSTPISKLAEEFGLSDRGLAKICQRHQIPVPGRGYWARLAAGQAPKKTPLWDPDNQLLQSVPLIASTPRLQSMHLDEILAAAKTMQRKEARPEEAPAQTPSAAVRVKLTTHVSSLITELRARQPDRDGYVMLKWVKVPPNAVSRVGELLNSITLLLQPYGLEFDHTGSRVCFRKDGSSVEFAINAPRKKVFRQSSRSSWRFQELEHVGRLEFHIYGHADGAKKNWQDTDGRKIEQAVSQIADSFLVNYSAAVEHDQQRRDNERRSAHLAHRKELAMKRAKREEARLEFLNWIAEARREAEDLRMTINLVPKGDRLPPEYLRMVSWAERRLSELDSLTSVSRIQDLLVEKELYADPDPLDDPEGELPPQDRSNNV